MNIFLTLFMLLFVGVNQLTGQVKEAYSHTSEVDPTYLDKLNYLQLADELEGTYQLQYNVIGMKPFIEKTTLARVSQERLPHEDLWLTLSVNVSVFIPSFETINSPEFIPLEREKYVAESPTISTNE